jgi:hypothetical protein
VKPKISLRELARLQETLRSKRVQRFLSGTPRPKERPRQTPARALAELTDSVSTELDREMKRIARSMADAMLFGSSVTYYPRRWQRRPFALWRWRQPKGPIYGKSPAVSVLEELNGAPFPYKRSAQEEQMFGEIAEVFRVPKFELLPQKLSTAAEMQQVNREIADYFLPRSPAKNPKLSGRFLRREWRRACRKAGLLPPGKARKGDEKRREQNPPGSGRP